jgi:two-component system, LytTR family, response regulator
MMQCAVIDDEPFALELIRDYINRTPFLELAGAFSNPFKALEFLNKQYVDLIFLDINMPELSGIQLLSSLLKQPMVVFTTAYPEFGAESYNYDAVDYLLKPIRYERFLKSANKASAKLTTHLLPDSAAPIKQASNNTESIIFVKSGNNKVKINLAEIICIEAAGNYLQFNTIDDKKIMALMSMKDVSELLPEDDFVRVHKSFIVSQHFIESIGRQEIRAAGKLIPIGITYREHFFQTMQGKFDL